MAQSLVPSIRPAARQSPHLRGPASHGEAAKQGVRAVNALRIASSLCAVLVVVIFQAECAHTVRAGVLPAERRPMVTTENVQVSNYPENINWHRFDAYFNSKLTVYCTEKNPERSNIRPLVSLSWRQNEFAVNKFLCGLWIKFIRDRTSRSYSLYDCGSLTMIYDRKRNHHTLYLRIHVSRSFGVAHENDILVKGTAVGFDENIGALDCRQRIGANLSGVSGLFTRVSYSRVSRAWRWVAQANTIVKAAITAVEIALRSSRRR